MRLQLLNNASVLNIMSAAVQSSSSQLVNLAVGSVLRAVLQANAAVVLWVQWLLTQVLLTTRAATSNGSDLDSWVADYGLSRLPAVAAQGMVVLSRTISSGVVLVSPGGLVRTGDGTQTYSIGTSTTNGAWSASSGAYQFVVGQSSIAVPVTAVQAGRAGNVQPGSISLLASSMPGVDSVTNNLATSGGMDAETDSALRARATTYFASLSRATTTAVYAAIASVQQGLTALVQENTPQSGQFMVIVDDGSGAPAASLLQAVYAAVDDVRPIGTIFSVVGPVVIHAAIAMTVTTNTAANHTAIISQIATAVAAMADSLPIGAPLPITRLAAIAYNTSSDVLNVTVTLNGGASDLVPSVAQVVRASSISVL